MILASDGLLIIQITLYIISIIIFYKSFALLLKPKKRNPYFDNHSYLTYNEKAIKNEAFSIANNDTKGASSSHKKRKFKFKNFYAFKKHKSNIAVLISQKRPHSLGWDE